MDADKRLHGAARSGECNMIKALAADGTDMNCPDPDDVRYKLIHDMYVWKEVGRMWPSHQPADLL